MDIGRDLQVAYEQGRSDVAREIFAEIEQELKAALGNNFDRKREHLKKVDQYDDFCWLISGKIDTLRGILDFLDELKQKYGIIGDSQSPTEEIEL